MLTMIGSERKRLGIMSEPKHYHGKNYIISLYMESIYLYRKYWQHLQLADLGKERTFPHIRCLEESLVHTHQTTKYGRAKMEDDLCQLLGPITNSSICKVLHQRFTKHQYHTFMGSTLIAVNPQSHRLSYKAMACSRGLSDHLKLLITNLLQQVAESRQSHSVIVSGETGSGKTRNSMELLRHLYDQAGGGPETDAFKVISAALTALRPFDTTATSANQESSRSCWSVECTVSRRAITSAHITLHSLSHSRLTGRPTSERCYDVFYMILAGMTREEREQCHLVAENDQSLYYIQNTYRRPINIKRHREKYSYWKDSLMMLGINHMEVLRLLSAVLLLGNVTFVQGEGDELEVEGSLELRSVASLLGVSVNSLYQCLTSRLLTVNEQCHRSANTMQQANKLRNNLAQSLYGRLFQYLIRKVNQSTESTIPSSYKHKTETSQASHSSGHGTESSAVNIIDCIGFQNTQGTQLEQLCSNICSEAIQHFYNMNTFHELIDSYDEEQIAVQSNIRWYDNSTTIQLLSQQHIGLISLLHSESKEEQPRPRSLTKKLEKFHSNSDCLQVNRTENVFTVHHFGGRVTYNCEILLLEDRNSIPDQVVAIFSKQSTISSLLPKLFNKELRDMEANGSSPRGTSYRAVPCYPNPYDTQPGSHGQDFLVSLDSFMQTLACSNPTFVRCIKASAGSGANEWDSGYVRRQVIMLELAETVKLLTSGLPHKLSYKEFASKYQCLSCHRLKYGAATTEHYQDFSQDIINQYIHEMEARSIPYSSSNWVFGRKHVFLSDDASRQLDMLRHDIRHKSACKIQSAFRGWLIRQSWPVIVRHMRSHKRGSKSLNSRSYDSGYNTPLSHRATNMNTGYHSHTLNSTLDSHNLYTNNTDHVFHWKPTFKDMQDMVPPPLPEKRKYAVSSGMKVYFPQIRVMKEDINVEGYELHENSEVLCVGYSSRPSHVSIAFQNDILEVPFDKTSIRIGEGCISQKHRTSDILATEL